MFLQKLKTQINTTFRTVFKSSCILCKIEISENNNLCSLCWNNMEFISEPACNVCGNPLDFADGSTNRCPECIVITRTFDKARAATMFNENSAKIIHNFKYYDQLHLSKKLAKFMYFSGRELIEEANVICSIPLYKTKFFKRKYNQAQLLAYYIAKYAKRLKNLDNDVLTRKKDTKPQSTLTGTQRKQNIKNAFAVKKSDNVRNKHVLLVDDVVTTGSTISECTKILKNAGARKVFILTFAKT